MTIDWIKRNVKVFSKELGLEMAYRIPGLRAVFGESYPDPVRVVTLEFDVVEIAKDVENPRWRQTSIEFCGGTYVFHFHLEEREIYIFFTDTFPRLEISRTL